MTEVYVIIWSVKYYLSLIFNYNLRWNLHTNYLVKFLHTLNFSFYKLHNVILLNIMKKMPKQDDKTKNAFRSLQLKQQNIIQIYFSKQVLEGSPNLNFTTFNILSVTQLYKNIQNKREHR